MKAHVKGLSFSSLHSIFRLQVQELDFCLKLHQLKITSLETKVSTFLNSVRFSGILRLTSYRLCSLPLLYIPHALNYSPITKTKVAATEHAHS